MDASFVQCGNCGAQGPSFEGDDRQDKAVASWNSPAPTDDAALVNDQFEAIGRDLYKESYGNGFADANYHGVAYNLNGWIEGSRQNFLAKVEAALAARGAGQGEAVAWVSPKQLEAHRDPLTDQPGREGGAYLPVRKTRAGQFTQPLYASPPLGGTGGWKPTHRHRARGSLYQVMATGRMQIASEALDDCPVTIYRDETDTWWTRPTCEFNDGRFERLAPSLGEG
jgi:hypothetical protein